MSELGNATVFIGADIGELQKGLKQATSEVTAAAKSMTIAIGAVTAVFATGVKGALNYGEEISKLSAITGMSTETLSRLQYTAKQNEVSFEALANSLKILARNVNEANTGNEKMSANFSQIGIAASDLRGMQIDQMLYVVADRFKNLKNDAERTALAMDIFGRSGANLIPILKLGSDGIKEFFEASDRLGNTLSGSQAKALKEFNDSIQDTQMYLRGIWVSIATEVGPAFESFFSALQKSNILKDAANSFKEILKAVAEIPAWFKLSAAAVVLFGTSLGRAFAILALFPDASKAVKFWWSAIQEDIAGLEKGMINFGLWLSKVTRIPIQNIEEMKARIAELNQEIDSQQQVQVGIVSEPLGIQTMLSDLNNFQQELNNFKTTISSGVGTIKPEVDTSDFMSAFDIMSSTISSFKGSWQGLTKSLQDFWKNTVTTFETTFSTAISSIILGTKSAKEAFSDFGKALIVAIVEFVVQYAVQAAVSLALGALISKFVSGMAADMASAWMPAAYLASVATMGGAVGAGTVALGIGAGTATALLAGMQAVTLKGAVPGGNAYTEFTPYKAAEGGIFEKPSLTWIAEKEPEAAIPLSKLGSFSPQGGGNTTNINISLEGAVISDEFDIEDLSNKLGQSIKRAMRGGVGGNGWA